MPCLPQCKDDAHFYQVTFTAQEALALLGDTGKNFFLCIAGMFEISEIMSVNRLATTVSKEIRPVLINVALPNKIWSHYGLISVINKETIKLLLNCTTLGTFLWIIGFTNFVLFRKSRYIFLRWNFKLS